MPCQHAVQVCIPGYKTSELTKLSKLTKLNELTELGERPSERNLRGDLSKSAGYLHPDRERVVPDACKSHECHECVEKERTADCERRDNRAERTVLYVSREKRAD